MEQKQTDTALGRSTVIQRPITRFAVALAGLMALGTAASADEVRVLSAVATAAALSAAPLMAPEGTPQRRPETAPQATQAESRAARFVIETLTSGSNSLAPLKAAYGPTVRYYKHGYQMRDAVLADKKALFTRWPNRHLTIDPSTVKATQTADGLTTVGFEADFKMSGDGISITGRTVLYAKVAESDGRYTIVAERGLILESQSHLDETRLAAAEQRHISASRTRSASR